MIIASRTLKLRRTDGVIEIPINIFAPECEKPGAWSCRYDVGWPEGNRTHAGWGFDSIQALVATLTTISAEIYSSTYHKSGNLYWDEPRNGYGFPVVGGVRDLLQGDDLKYL
jgi:hypothetical protein